MPRKYQRVPRSRRYTDYSEEELHKAIDNYKKKKGNLRSIGEQYGIPFATLYRKCKNLHPKKHGGQTVLSENQEMAILRAIICASDWGFPYEEPDVKDLVQNFLNRSGINIKKFKHNRPGHEWYMSFVERHRNEISTRFSQSIKQSRAKINYAIINKYFDCLSVSLADVHPAAIINYDETNFTDDPGRVKVIVRRKSKRAEKIQDTSKSATSVMFSCSASGIMLPVCIVYKSDHLWTTWTERGPEKARYNRSSSGWFDIHLFEDWFVTTALPYFKMLPPGPKVIIGDNLASHISLNVIQLCESNNIRFILLPPNSTHLTQQYDVCVFRPIKQEWRKALQAWKRHNKGVVRKDVFPMLLNQALHNTQANEKNIKAGFMATGIVPLDREKILDRLPKEHENTEQQAIEDNIVTSMSEIFQNARYGNPHEPSTSGKKKKLTVAPGESISYEQLKKQEKENVPKPKVKIRKTVGKQRTKQDTQKKNDYKLPEEEPNTEEISCGEQSVLSEAIDNIEKENCEKNFGTRANPLVGEYVAVMLKTTKGTDKKYVAKILSEESDSYMCKFLRPSQKSHDVFIFPAIEDIGIVLQEEIIEILKSAETLRRGGVRISGLSLNP